MMDNFWRTSSQNRTHRSGIQSLRRPKSSDEPAEQQVPLPSGYDGPGDKYDGPNDGYDGPKDGYDGARDGYAKTGQGGAKRGYDRPDRYDGPARDYDGPKK